MFTPPRGSGIWRVCNGMYESTKDAPLPLRILRYNCLAAQSASGLLRRRTFFISAYSAQIFVIGVLIDRNAFLKSIGIQLSDKCVPCVIG